MTLDEATALLDSLAYGDRACDQQILEQGEVPDDWMRDFESAMDLVETETKGKQTWSRKLAAAIHFISLYLPVRYEAWKNLTKQSSPGMSPRLAKIRTRCELFLVGWRVT